MSNPGKPHISLVIPAYNEGDHILEILEETDRVMESLGAIYEIIVVNDGSKDETELKAFEYANNNNHVKVISYDKNAGKGFALKTGFFNAVGDSVVFMDGDLDINPQQIRKYVKALKSGDIVIGSKRHPESYVEAPPVRKFLSLGFNLLVRLLTGLKLSDTQSGLKAVRRKGLKKVFSVLSVKRFAFDVELLAVANLYGLSIVEMPVNIKLTNSFFHPKEIFKMFIDLLGVAYRLKIKKQYLDVNESLHEKHQVLFE